MKAIILDCQFPNEPRLTSVFETLATEECGWEFDVIPSFHYWVTEGQAADGWFPRVQGLIHEADVLLLFGSFTIFRMAGDFAQDIFDMLIEKIEAGTPCLIQAIRLGEKFVSQEALIYERDFLRKFNVTPSPIKVGSHLNMHPEIGQEYYCYYDKSHDAPRRQFVINALTIQVECFGSFGRSSWGRISL